MFNTKILKSEEQISFSLRSLYSRFGYRRYKMSKFEEYDLYVRNKDFLISDSIITFTDTNGRLMALKPDVTLSIVKNIADTKGTVTKLYYDENVYRISESSHSFKEIAQTGLECVGDISLYEICEVVMLSIKSLSEINENYILDLSHAGLVSAIFNSIGIDNETKAEVLTFIKSKNSSGLKALEKSGKLTEGAFSLILKLLKTYRDTFEFKEAFSAYTYDKNIAEALNEFTAVCEKLTALGLMKNVNIDFSIVDDMNYYSGVLFKGYIKDIPTAVLSGGQYDKLMKKMKKSCGALGFAVYLDMFERLDRAEEDFDCDCLILKSRATDPSVILKAVNQLTANNESVIVSEIKDEKLKYRKILDLREGESD